MKNGVNNRWLAEISYQNVPKFFFNDLLDPRLQVIIEDEIYLISADFEVLTSIESVWKKANSLCESLDAIAKLSLGEHAAILTKNKIAERMPDGTKKAVSFCTATFVAGFHIHVKPTVIGPDGKALPPPPPLETLWSKLAIENSNVREALGYYRELNLKSFYKVYEVLRDDFGGDRLLKKQPWVNSSRLERFLRTVNHPEASGNQSRHARNKAQRPSNPMPFHEANSFIQSLLREWMYTKSA